MRNTVDNIARGMATDPAVQAAVLAGLGGLPRRNPCKIAPIGDSRIAAIYIDPAQRGYNAMSPLNWANALLGQRLVIGTSWGVSGDTTQMMLARIDAAVASNAGILYIQGGLNNYVPGFTAAATAADLIFMAEKGRTAGMLVVLEAEVGNTDMNTPAEIAWLSGLNQRLRDYRDATPAIYLHDARAAVLDTTAASAVVWKTNYTYDATHVNGRGAYRWGKSLAVLLGTLVPPNVSPLLQSVIEGDPANGLWQIAANPLLSGSGGTASNGCTGTIPASWIAGPNVAGPVCSSAVMPNTLGQSVTIDCTYTAAGQYARLAQSVANTQYNAGNVLQFFADVEILTPGPLSGLVGVMSNTMGGIPRDIWSLYTDTTANYYGPDEPCRFTMLSRPYELSAGSKDNLVLGVRGYTRAAGQAVFTVHQMGLRRRTDFGY